MSPDRLNPRVWLRNWLLKSTRAERSDAVSSLNLLASQYSLKLDHEANITGYSAQPRQPSEGGLT